MHQITATFESCFEYNLYYFIDGEVMLHTSCVNDPLNKIYLLLYLTKIFDYLFQFLSHSGKYISNYLQYKGTLHLYFCQGAETSCSNA